MAVISLTITEATTQIISGIPTTVTVSANIPSTIFYTLDGTTPTFFSSVYLAPIPLPTNIPNLTLKLLASNGTDSSPIFSKIYGSDISNARSPHSALSNVNNSTSNLDIFPFGNNSPNPNVIYNGTKNAGITVDNPLISQIPQGFDASGNPAAFTNLPIDNYNIIYSTSNVEGETGIGIGNLPSKVTLITPPAPPESSSRSSNLFDPRAMVIFQDSRVNVPLDQPCINKQYFSLENPEKVRDGNLLFNSGLDAPTTTGSFVKSHYNPTDNTINYYYYDNNVNRWIISKEPYQPKVDNSALYNMVFSREEGVGFIFQWKPFASRILI